MDEKSDAMLVAEVLAGRREAFADLVRRHQHYAYGTAIGVLSDFEMAQDVVQEAFLAAYQELENLRDPARFGGWVRGIVRHMAYRGLREMERVRALAAELSREMDGRDPAPLPDQRLEAAQQREMVQSALARLAAKNREVVSLHYVDRLSYAEIAVFLDVSETAVQGRLQRARAALRKEWRMVEKQFKENRLKKDFAAQIQELLDTIAAGRDGRRAAFRRLASLGEPAVEPLRAALDDERDEVRRAAAVALCTLGDGRGLQPVLDLLYAPNWRPSPSHLEQALEIPGMRAVFLKAASGADQQQRWTALRALATVERDDEICARFDEVFRDAAMDSRSRLYALRGLGKTGGKAARQAVEIALADGDPQVFDQGLRLAGEEGLLPSVDLCRGAFAGAKRGESRRRAAQLLLECGEEGEEILEDSAQQGAVEERVTAALLLAEKGMLGPFVSLMRELLDGRDGEALEWIAVYESVPERLPDVFWTRAESHFEHFAPVVEGLYHSGAPAVRTAALRLLARQRGESFLPELRRCFSGETPQNARVAQEAFKQIARLGEVALPAAEEMFESEDWSARKAAVRLLRHWDQLTPELQARAAADAHVAVRRAAGVR